MRNQNTYIAKLSRRLGSVVFALLVMTFETGFFHKPLVIETPLLITLDSPFIDTRMELLTALDQRAPHLSELERIWLADIVAQAAFTHGVDPFLVLAVMMVESEFKDIAKSHAGAVGFMQLRAPTAFESSERIGMLMPALGLYDWEANVNLGASYLRFLRDRMGSWKLALAGYNWGPTKVYRGIRAAGGRLPPHMRGYEKRVSRAYERLSRSAARQTRTALTRGGMDTNAAI